MNLLQTILPEYNPLKDSLTLHSVGPYFYIRYVQENRNVKAMRLHYDEKTQKFKKFDPKKLALEERRLITRTAYNGGLGVKPQDIAAVFNIAVAIVLNDVSPLQNILSKPKEGKTKTTPKNPWSSLGV